MSLIARSLGCLCVAMGAAAAGPGLPAPQGPFLALFPQLQTAPAPAWVRPGLRLTLESAVMTTPPSPATGSGLIQYDVVALDAKTAVLEYRLFTVLAGRENPVLGGFGSVVAPVGNVAACWMNPDVLKGAPQVHGDGIVFLRMPYEAGGKTIPAIQFEFKTPTSRQSKIFEEATGLLLYSSMDMVVPDETVASHERRTLLQGKLVDCRQVAVPWAGAPLPAWLTQTNVLEYEGTQSLIHPGFPPTTIAFRSRAEVTARGANWVQYGQTMSFPSSRLPSAATPTTRVSGAAQFGGLWIGPEAAKDLRPGQELDRDPHTHVVTSVTAVGPDANGTDVVVITEANAAQKIDYTYDRASGGLLLSHDSNAPLHQEKQSRLTLRQ